MLPNASDLHYFLVICETQNISRAAERLGISQPSLTMALQRLEKSLEAKIVNRSKRGISLTKAGQQLQERAKSLLDSWEGIKQSALNAEAAVQGQFLVGCHPSVATYALAPILRELFNQYPLLDLQLRHDLSRRITEQVISQKIDLGIVINPVPHPDLIIKELSQDRVCFWSSRKDNPRASEQVLICDPDLLQSQELMRKIPKNKQFKRMLHTGNLELVREMVASGAGIGIIPGKVVSSGKSELFELKDYPVFKDRICIVYRVENKNVATLRLMVEKISSLF
jgi:DNA-binding transcriptional LysR family regulator